MHQLNLYKIGLRQFKGSSDRRYLNKNYHNSFICLSSNMKGRVRVVFARIGLNPGNFLDPAEQEVGYIIKCIGAWSCKNNL